MVGKWRKFVRRPQGPFRIVLHDAISLVGEPKNAFEIASVAHGINQLQKSVLALPTNGIVHIGGVQGRIRVVRSEVTTPNDGYLRKARAYLATGDHSSQGLRSRHH